MGPRQTVNWVGLWSGRIQNHDRSSGSSPGSMSNATLTDSLDIVVYQDHYGGHYRKKNGCLKCCRRLLAEIRNTEAI
jgi:hypothetical protein